MEREAVLVGVDVGTSKVCTLIGEVSRDGRLTIMGHGTVPSSGLKKGVVVNIDQTVRSIAESVERAERLSGWKIDRAFVAVGGQHVESLNSPGQVAVSGQRKEVTREDVNRAIEVARAVSIPSNQEVLHVERRGFKVDGQEGVKDPLGMSALRLEVEVHIVTGSATAVQNLSKCVAAAGVKIDELVVNALASSEAVLNETEKELGVAVADFGAGTIDLALFLEGSPFHTRRCLPPSHRTRTARGPGRGGGRRCGVTAGSSSSASICNAGGNSSGSSSVCCSRCSSARSRAARCCSVAGSGRPPYARRTL